MGLEIASAGQAPKGWFAGFFRASKPQFSPAPRRPAPAWEPSPALSAAALAAEQMEARMRAATSGFELGEYEPIVRRN